MPTDPIKLKNHKKGSLLWKVTKYITVLILIVISGMVLWVGYRWYEHQDPQGEASSNCIKKELPQLSNGSDMVVSAHETACDGFGGSWAIYIYVHKLNEVESKKSLVFRFSESTGIDSQNPYPTFEWTSKNALRISINHVAEVTKQLDTMKGINITYAIGKVDYPQAQS